MSKYVHPDVLDKGLEEIVNNCDLMVLIDSYTPGDSYAVVESRSVCDVVMVGGDFTLQTFETDEREVEVAAKSGTAKATSPLTPDLHIALMDSIGSRVLCVANETSDQPVSISNPVDFPSWIVRAKQPV